VPLELSATTAGSSRAPLAAHAASPKQWQRPFKTACSGCVRALSLFIPRVALPVWSALSMSCAASVLQIPPEQRARDAANAPEAPPPPSDGELWREVPFR
jgi:hypothetical protein